MTLERARGLLNQGLARPTTFAVKIPWNEKTGYFTNEAERYLRFFCKTTQIPEIAFETVGAAGQQRTGIIRQQPTMVKFGKPFTMDVIERSDYVLYKNFQQWANTVSPTYNIDGGSQRMAYYEDFTMDIKLKKFEYAYETWNPRALQAAIDAGKVNYESYRKPIVITFHKAYPVILGDLNLDTEAQNSMLTFQISFNYESYDIRYDETDDD